MKKIFTVPSLLTLFLIVVFCGAAFAQVPYTKGDVFASLFDRTVKEFTPTGTLVQTLTTDVAANNTGGAFDSAGNFFVTTFNADTVSKFDNSGHLINGSYATGLNASPESIVFARNGNFFVGRADGTHQITLFSPGATTATQLSLFAPATQNRGTDWIELAADQHTIYYTSEGTLVKRFDISTNTQLADLNTVPLPGGAAYALRLLPNGNLLVADSDQVVQLSTTGAIVKQYTTSDTFSGHSPSSLFALNLDPDGTTFWTGELGGTNNIYHVNIATGALINFFSAGPSTQELTGLSVYGEVTQGGGGPPSTVPALSTLGLILCGILLVFVAGAMLRRKLFQA
jgi:streptogramin lyase